MSARVLVALLVGSLITSATLQAQTTWYVDDDADPNGDGMSWASAFNDLQDALDVATYDDEIRVAAGTYLPSHLTDPNDPRTATFELISSVGMYGGYAGLADPNHPDDRDIELYETILSGDLDGNDGPGPFENSEENSYHVVRGNQVDAATVIDGFTITAGYANGNVPHYWGGGFYSNRGSLTVLRCTFSNNAAAFGGGMCSRRGSPTVSECAFLDNQASYGGGGLTLATGSLTVTNCVFENNSAGFAGGGVRNGGGNLTLSGCVFANNRAEDEGGGMYHYHGEATLIDCLFTDNTVTAGFMPLGGGMSMWEASTTSLLRCTFANNHSPQYGGGICIWGSSPTLTLCVFQGNTAALGGGLSCLDWVQHDDPASDPWLTGCVFTGNHATVYGGAWHGDGAGMPVLSNCTFSQNVADINGGGLGRTRDFHFSGIGYEELTNCILWNDFPEEVFLDNTPSPLMTYTDTQGGWPGEGNIDEDPMFVDADAGNVHLLSGSPCINAGDPEYVPDEGETDLDGQPRVVYGRVDMGADEYLCLGDLDNDGVIGLMDLAMLLDNYHTPVGAIYEDGDLDCDGDVDLADLAELLGLYGMTCE